MVIFLASDIINWNGTEFGIVAQINGTIYGYVQNETIYANYFPIATNDNQIHNYNITLIQHDLNTEFIYYQDDIQIYNFSHQDLDNFITTDYHLVFATHRYGINWDSQEAYMLVGEVTIIGIDPTLLELFYDYLPVIIGISITVAVVNIIKRKL